METQKTQQRGPVYKSNAQFFPFQNTSLPWEGFPHAAGWAAERWEGGGHARNADEFDLNQSEGRKLKATDPNFFIFVEVARDAIPTEGATLLSSW